MLPASRALLPVVGVDIHIVIIPPGVPTPIPHPYIGMVFDPMDFVPVMGSSVNVNNIPRANAGTSGMLGTKVHIPLGGPFATPPLIAHESNNFFGSPRVSAEGSYFTGAGYMVMTCNDVGMPLSVSPGKKFKPEPSLFLPSSASIPIPGGMPVIVGGPYVPDLMTILSGLAMSFGFGCLMKLGGMALKKALTALNHGVLKKFKSTKSLSDSLCKHGFEPVNLINGSVLYEGCDFEIPGPIPVKWNRRWYSDSDYEGLLGHGTHCNYDQTMIVFDEDDAIGLMLPDGRTVGFPLIRNKDEAFYLRAEKLTITCRRYDFYEVYDHNTKLTHHFKKLHDNVFKLRSIFNVGGLALQFFYDQKYCLEKIIDTAGREIIIRLDAFGRAVEVEAHHRGQTKPLVTYVYNEAGDLNSITDPYDQTTFVRFANHLMIEKTDRNGQTFYWEYDGFSTGARCIHTYGDGGLLEGWIEYRAGYNIVSNSLNEQTTYYYDENDLCIQQTNAVGNSIFFEYTDDMELYREIDAEGNITGYVYDEKGNLTQLQNHDGSITSSKYDDHGNLTLVTDADGGSTIYVYKDGLVNIGINPDQATTHFEYNDKGLLKTLTNALNQKTRLEYDPDYNITQIILADGTKAFWEYDVWGRCINTTNPENQSEQFTYDRLDRIIRVKKYDGNVIKLKYDAYSDVLVTEDKLTQVHFEYTPLGKIKQREERNEKINFQYDTEGRLIALANERYERYKFNYDRTGNIVEEIGFDGLKRNFERDRAGKVIRINRPGGKYSDYEYDLANNITRIEHSDGFWEQFGYNKNGQLISAENEYSKTIFARDQCGRIVKDTQDGYTVKSRYDKLGRRVGFSSNLGAAVDFNRNNTGRVEHVKAVAENNNWEAKLQFNLGGQELERLLPGNVRVQFQYDRAGRPQQQKVSSSEKLMRNRTYTWNVSERLQSMMNNLTRGSIYYNHDDFGNLVWAQYDDNKTDHRAFDNVGNIYRSKDKKDRKYTPGGLLQEASGTVYKYDDEGNLIQKTSASGQEWRYEWTGNGMLKKVIRPDQKEVIFEYDALGRRTAKLFNNNITRWVWDGNKPLHEWEYSIKERPVAIVDEEGELIYDKEEPNPLANTTTSITWLFDEGGFKPAAKLEKGSSQSIITDYLGTPVEMYVFNGTQTWSVEYDIYGKIRKQTVGIKANCPFRYQGQYEDEETGLYYNRFRYYEPDEGIYLSQDPIRLIGGMNFYTYVFDCTIQLDPFGLILVYRALNGGQESSALSGNDIQPKDINATHTIQEHIDDGSLQTQYISTTKKKGTAEFYSKPNPKRGKLAPSTIIEIDTDKLDPSKVFDMSSGIDPQTGKALDQPALRYAKKDAEVIIEGPIPKGAYKICT